MWIEKENPSDPYGRAQNNTNVNVGAGAGKVAPNGSNTQQGNPSTTSPASPTPPTQQFATIQDYLGANKQQGEDLGQKVTSSLSDTYNNEKGSIDTAANNTSNKINQNTVNFDQGLVDEAVKTPTSVANDPNKLPAFQKQWNASYNGPNSFESSDDYGTASAAANEANTKAAQLATTGGREQLLQDQFGVYGQGNKGLDASILQSSTFDPQLQQQKNQFGSIKDYLTNAANNVNASANAAKTATDTARTNTQNAFANSLTKFQTNLNDETAAARGTATTAANQLKADFASGDPNKVVADLKKADPNIDAQTIQQYLTAMNSQTGKPTDLSQFYNFNPNTQVTTSNVATPEEYANAAALQKLTGVDYSGILSPGNASQASTIPNPNSGMSSANSIIDYLKNQYGTAIGGTGYTAPKSPTEGVPGIPSTPSTGPTLTSNLGINGIDKINLPTNATPDTVKTLQGVFGTGLSGAGTYHEGALYDLTSRVQQLQSLANSGAITKDQYQSYVQPILNFINTFGSGATGKALNSYQQAKQHFHSITGL